MNKKGLAVEVAAKTGLSKKDVEAIHEATFEVISEVLAEGGTVDIFGHGKYEVRERAARKGYNPKLLKELKEQGLSDADAKAQAQVDIAASKNVGFKPAKKLKTAVQ